MTARPRDLQKSRTARLAAVAHSVSLKAGGANTQLVLDGCVIAVGGTNTQFQTSAGEVFLAQALTAIAAVAGTAVPAGAATSAGQFRKVAVDVTSAGAIVTTVGAVADTQANAVLPQTPADSITIGWLEIPASFVPGTTAVTTGMCKQMPYDNGSAV